MISAVFSIFSLLVGGGSRMDRPTCPDHPKGRVWRDGHYGKNGQYQRWRCNPPGGQPPRLFQPTLPRK